MSPEEHAASSLHSFLSRAFGLVPWEGTQPSSEEVGQKSFIAQKPIVVLLKDSQGSALCTGALCSLWKARLAKVTRFTLGCLQLLGQDQPEAERTAGAWSRGRRDWDVERGLLGAWACSCHKAKMGPSGF